MIEQNLFPDFDVAMKAQELLAARPPQLASDYPLIMEEEPEDPLEEARIMVEAEQGGGASDAPNNNSPSKRNFAPCSSQFLHFIGCFGEYCTRFLRNMRYSPD